jgi:GNAT superfamily N-acetyltransferase
MISGPLAATVRTATPDDRASILALQRVSLIGLGRDFYSDFEIESYLRYTPTLEDYLLADATYYVAHVGEHLAACGGWSIKPPAYSTVTRDVRRQGHELPKVRAMYVHPDFARRGLGRRVLAVIEAAIVDAGYVEAGVDATLGGAPLYQRCGYSPIGETHAALPNGAQLRFVCMYKRLVATAGPEAPR